MRRLLPTPALVATAVVALSLSSQCHGARGEDDIVHVSVTDANGVGIIGRTSRSDGSAVDSFLGIKFADATRFKPSVALLDLDNDPSPPSSSGGGANANATQIRIINATEFGPHCIQSFAFGPPVPQSEDCLFLNIWRPSDANSSRSGPLPTMVWIHGGGFFAGSGSEPLYDGSELAREQNVIVVTVNYRLAVFGFLVTGPNGEGGMNGIYDQINALKWVNRHISTFGGDPSAVTVFGESAGGVSCCLLSVAPLAVGLFQRSVIESGQCVTDRLGPLDPSEGGALADTFLESAGVDSIEDLDDKTTEEIVEASMGSFGTSMFSSPTIDGWVMPIHPRELYIKEGVINPTDLIVGSNTYDDASLLGIPPAVYIGRAQGFEQYVHGIFDDDYGTNASDAVVRAYSPIDRYGGSKVSAMAQFNGDYMFRCGGRELAAMAAGNIAGKVYLYAFGHLSAGDLSHGLLEMAGIDDDPHWSSHTAEIPFVFGNLNDTFNGPAAMAPTNADAALSKQVMARWASFARSGDPNACCQGELASWTAVPEDLSADPSVASDAPFLWLKSGGVEMVQSSGGKLEQCSAIPGMALLRVNDDVLSAMPVPTSLPSEGPLPAPSSAFGGHGRMAGKPVLGAALRAAVTATQIAFAFFLI